MDEETWTKGGELMPELKTSCNVEWIEEGVEDEFMSLCALLKGNAIPTGKLDLIGDEKE